VPASFAITVVCVRPDATLAGRRGCRIKPAEETCSALAEVHSRADVRDDLAMDRPLAREEMGDFGAHA
jgi:hypothetical protein